jgi:phosphate transport system substrate-binding protein
MACVMRPMTVARLCAPVALGLFTVAAARVARAAAAEVALSETGSTLIYPVFRICAAEYPKTHPGVTVTAAATDSGAGYLQV